MPNPAWDRQKKEIEAYNTFYSAYTGRASDDSFHDRGFYIRGLFAKISASSGDNPEPDFILYDGSTFLMAEVKAGDNIETRHIEQMEKCTELTIIDAQDYLSANQVAEETPYDGNVDEIESFIVFCGLDEDYIDEWRGESEDFTNNIEQLESLVPILGAEPGERLRILSGSFSNTTLNEWLGAGIELPENPKKEFYLTDGLEYESIAVAICQNWGEIAVKGADGVSVTVSDVRERFEYRPPPISKILDVFKVLVHLGACDQGDNDREFVFNITHMRRVLGIEELMREKPFSEYLQEVASGGSSEDQRDMDDFSEDDDSS